MKSKLGFTMIELTIVLIMIGILTASLAPLLLRQHTNAMEERDRVALAEAQTAIISYATTFGGIPNPGAGIGAVAGAMSAVPAFGVNNWGAFGNANLFQMDVNASLVSDAVTVAAGQPIAAGGGDRPTFCQAVNAAMSSVNAGMPAVPSICQDTTADHVSLATACTASAVPVAFVLYSTGNDRIANQENDETGAIGVNHIYENDKRGINNIAGVDHYDDQVMSYPLSALARDCREKMGVLPEVMNCGVGQKYVRSLTNNYVFASGGAYGFANPPSSSVPTNGFTLYVNSCHARGDTLWVNPESGVAASAVAVGTLNAIDANGDGQVDVFISTTGVPTAQ